MLVVLLNSLGIIMKISTLKRGLATGTINEKMQSMIIVMSSI